ncbi:MULTISPECIES: hypothetical protein [unclassified Nonomuraea]
MRDLPPNPAPGLSPVLDAMITGLALTAVPMFPEAGWRGPFAEL